MSHNNIKVFRARWLLPISQPPIEDGDIVIDSESNKIVDIGTHQEIRKKYSQKLIKDFGNSIIFPGFVNAHIHLEQDRWEGRPNEYFEYLRQRPDIEKRDKKEIVKNIKNNLQEAHNTGTVAFANFAKTGYGNNEIVKSKNFCRTFMELSGFRNIDASDIYRKYENIINKHNNTGSHTYHLAISNLWSTSPELLRKISAHELHTALHYGLVENERTFFLDGDGGIKQFLLSQEEYDYSWETPHIPSIKYFLRNKFNAKHNILAHACEITEDDVDIINKYDTKINICVCPRSDQNLGLKQTPIKMLQEKGMNVCLGTEGKYMVDDLDIKKELQTLVQDFGISAENAMKIATLNGAYSIGFHKEVGSLSKNKTAECYVIDHNEEYSDPYESIVLSEKNPERILEK